MEQKRKPLLYVAIGAIVVILIGVLWVRYANMQRLMRDLDSILPMRAERAAAALLERGALADALPAQSEERRANAARALAEVGSEAAMEQLVALIKDPEDPPQRAAADALGSLGAPAIPHLLPVLAADDRAKDAAVTAFEMIGEAAVADLTEALKDADRREYAAIALGKIGGSGVEPLLKAARGRDHDLRAIAIRVLGEERVARAVSDAIDALEIEELQRTAIIALGLIGDPAAAEPIMPFLADRELRVDTATSLGQIGDPRAVGPLLRELRDPERQFHERGVWALGRIGRPAVPLLTAALGSDSVYVRRAAAEALRFMHAPESVSYLVGALRDPDVQVRAAAARALGWKGNVAAVSPLLAALGDPHWQVADAASAALAQVAAPAVEPLIGLFESPDPTRRLLASEALAQMDEPPLQRLLQATHAAAANTREWAVITLGKIGDDAALDRLREIARTGDERMQWVAAEALRRLGVLDVSR